VHDYGVCRAVELLESGGHGGIVDQLQSLAHYRLARNSCRALPQEQRLEQGFPALGVPDLVDAQQLSKWWNLT